MRALAVGLLLATLPHSTTGRRKAKKAAKQQQQGAAPSTTHLLPFEELDGLPPPGAADRDTASRPRFLPELGLPSDFLSTSWDNEPRLIRLGPSAFRGMMDLSSGDLETLISSNSLRMGADAQFSQDGNKGAGTLPTLTLDEARWRLDDGASIMITALENFWPKCAPLVTATQRALRFYASINMYLTPPEARGFNVHFDYEDVLIIQVHGSKRWRLWAPDPAVGQMELPARNDHRTVPGKSTVPTQVPTGIEMQRGDVLYIPRGYPHMAETTGGNSSVHFTMTVMSQEFTWEVYLLMLAQPDTSSSGPVEADGYHPLWSDEARTVANLPQYWNVLQRNHGGCSMHDGSAFSTSSALLLGLHRAAMEPSARGFRESFSPFWEGGDERFRGACEQWQAELIGGLELSEREGLLVCPKGTDHSSLLPLLEALLAEVEWSEFKGALRRRAVSAWRAATGGEPPPFDTHV